MLVAGDCLYVAGIATQDRSAGRVDPLGIVADEEFVYLWLHRFDANTLELVGA